MKFFTKQAVASMSNLTYHHDQEANLETPVLSTHTTVSAKVGQLSEMQQRKPLGHKGLDRNPNQILGFMQNRAGYARPSTRSVQADYANETR